MKAFKGQTNLKRLEEKLEAQRTSTVLCLNDCYIGDEGCQILARFLAKYTNITDLELKGNNIGGPGITALSNAIRTSYSLRSIGLEWNNLGQSETGLQNLFSALTDSRSITKVDLRNNEIGQEVGSCIASCLKSNTTLQFLDLRWNRVGNTGAKNLLKGLNVNKYLQGLDLNGNKVNDEYMKQINDLLNRNK